VAVPELDPGEREVLLTGAILAPSMHNTQPWLFRFCQCTVEVHRDPSRDLGAEDPDGRLTLIGVGAAIFNLRVAAASLGREATTVLWPDPNRPTLAAEVRLGSALSEIAEQADLFPYLSRRRTNRFPFEDRPVPTEVQQDLTLAAAIEGAKLDWVEDASRARRLLQLASDADFAEADDPARIVERGMWVGGERTDDGVPSTSLGPRAAESSSPVRDLAVDPGDRLRDSARFEPHPTFAVLSTARHDPTAWLVAGQALQRTLLVATSHGLAVSLLNQPVEHKDLRQLIRDQQSGWGEPQAVLRLGYGPDVLPTPRRPIDDFVLEDEIPGNEGGE
jgi:hypothetical protein